MCFLPLRFAIPFGVLAFLIAAPALAQSSEPAAPDSTSGPADYVDERPEIVGGLGALLDRVVYPPEAEKAQLEGEVLVGFVVDEAGRVVEAQVIEGAHPLLDEAALEAVRATPFLPGKRAGTPVPVEMALPITFTLPAPDG